MDEVIVEVESLFGIPRQVVDSAGSFPRPPAPLCRVVGMAEDLRDFGGLSLHQVEKGIQADRIVMDNIDVKRAKPA